MKKIFFTAMGVILFFTACTSGNQPAQVDLAAAKNAVNSLLDKYNSALKAKDMETVLNLMTDDGLYCGTDAKEVMNKMQVGEMMKQTMQDSSFIVDYTVDKREILVSPDGNSAVAIEQMIFKPFSAKMPIRMVYHLIREGDNWHFNFLCWNFIPDNDDLPKINEALKQ